MRLHAVFASHGGFVAGGATVGVVAAAAANNVEAWGKLGAGTVAPALVTVALLAAKRDVDDGNGGGIAAPGESGGGT